MPKGPGKKENYNFDYSRFNGVDKDEEEEPGADAAAGEGVAAMQKMPPDLQEAFRLMSIAKATGNEEAERRANELALESVQRGGPQVKRDFMAHLSKESPEIAKRLSEELNKSGHKQADMSQVLDKLVAADGSGATSAESQPEEISSKVSRLKEQLQEGAETTRRQLEALERQQQQVDSLKSPDDIMSFLQQQGGLQQEDLQRIFGGDDQHMEKCVRRMLDSADGDASGSQPGKSVGMEQAEEAVKTVEQLHSVLHSDGDIPEGPASASAASQRGPEEGHTSVPETRKPKPPPEPEVVVPVYRLQYRKDADGRYSAVELTCVLPGVQKMEDIALDISERHLRLNAATATLRYAVNAGPFPVLIDPNVASAKFSRKKEELTINAPAKMC